MIKWYQRTLFRRLIISYLISVLLGIGITGLVISYSTTSLISQTTEQEMLHQAKTINLTLQQQSTTTPELENSLEFFDQSFDKRILVFDRSGKIVTTSMLDKVFVGKEMDQAIVSRINKGQEVIQNLKVEGMDRPLLSVIVPWGKEDEIYGGIVLNAPIAGIRSTIRNIREIVLWAMIFGIIISTILVSYLSWTISRPLKRIERAATEIALGNYSKRVGYHPQDEIGELAKSFDRMAEKLDSIERDRQAREQKRDDFIANVSHELRTPLTAMQGFIEALQDGLVKDEESRQRYYNVMFEESKYLNRLVHDLMDLLKMEKKQVVLNQYLVNVKDIIKKVVFTLEEQFKEKENKIDLDIPENIPLIYADAIRLEQIFINLLQNANKYTEQGSIHIQLTASTDEMIIKVEDTGIGIPSHDLSKIWDRFFKVDRVRSKKESGTGLGLAIVKELVELHQGYIDVESLVGKGTTFTIILPLSN